MQTLDAIIPTSNAALSSPAVARNTEAILKVLRAHMPARAEVLEIASGTGEHAVAFAGALPGLEWTPSDPSAEARASIAAWAGQARLANLKSVLAADVLDEATWPSGTVQAVVCINMIHISPWAATEGLIRLAGRVLTNPGGLLMIYGPFREAGVETAPSNAAFDESLRARDPAWGLRALEDVVAVAEAHGLAHTLRVAMPANNPSLLFRRV